MAHSIKLWLLNVWKLILSLKVITLYLLTSIWYTNSRIRVTTPCDTLGYEVGLLTKKKKAFFFIELSNQFTDNNFVMPKLFKLFLISPNFYTSSLIIFLSHEQPIILSYLQNCHNQNFIYTQNWLKNLKCYMWLFNSILFFLKFSV